VNFSIILHLHRVFRILLIISIIASSFLSLPSHSVSAATFTLIVDTDEDYDFGDSGASTCTADPLDCSLRGAVARANANPDDLFIIDLTAQFPAGRTFYLNRVGYPSVAYGDDDNKWGDLDVWGNIEIKGGNDPSLYVIDARTGSAGTSLDRVLDIHFDASADIHGVTIQYGLPQSTVVSGVDPEPAEPSATWVP